MPMSEAAFRESLSNNLDALYRAARSADVAAPPSSVGAHANSCTAYIAIDGTQSGSQARLLAVEPSGAASTAGVASGSSRQGATESTDDVVPTIARIHRRTGSRGQPASPKPFCGTAVNDAPGNRADKELVSEGMYVFKKYEPILDKTMRIHSVTSTIENGFVHLPDKAAWLPEYLHELSSFPKGKYDDQADSTSQALDWFKQQSMYSRYGLLEYYKQEAEKIKAQEATTPKPFVFTRADLLRDRGWTRSFDRFW